MTENSGLSRRSFFRKSFVLGKWALFWLLFPFANGLQNAGAKEGRNPASSGMDQMSLRELAGKKMHHGEGRFLNPFASVEHGNLWRVLSWKLFSKNHFKRWYKDEPVTPVEIDWDSVRGHGGCSVTFIKHASVMIKDEDQYILIDPVFFDLFLFKDFSPLAFDMKKMPKPNHILITHGHYDHLDKPTLQTFSEESHVIAPLGYHGVFEDLGMKNRTHLDWFESFKDGKCEITLLPCHHWTMRNPLVGPNRSLWGSFLIRTASGFKIFVSGDAAYFDRYKEIGEMFSIDLAVFNLGAYEPRWFMADSHMNPLETLKAFLDLKARRLLVVHWGSFRLGDEPVHFPPLDMKKEMTTAGLLDRLVRLNHGETYFLN